MKYLRKYNESVRDNMKPRSEEDIFDKTKNLSADDKVSKGSEYGIIPLIKQGLEEGSDINRINPITGKTPLTIAINKHNLEVIDFLIDNGVDINKGDGHSANPLVEAGMNGQVDLIKLFLDKGADINSVSSINWTSLMYAICFGHYDAVKFLLDNGADINVKGNDGYTALTATKSSKMLNLIKQYMKTNESVRDMLKPKSEEDIIKSLDKLSPEEKLKLGIDNNIEWVVKQALEEGAVISCHHMNKAGTLDTLKIFNILSKHLNFDYYNELRKNESVRDMLKPKSKEDIKKLMDKYINVYPKLGTFDPGSFGLTMDVKQSTPTVGDFILVDEKNNHWHMTLSDWNGKYSIRLAAHAPNFLIFRREFFKFNSFDELENYLISIGYKKMNESVRDMLKPKSEEEIEQGRKGLIDYINRIVKINGGSISMKDIEAESSIVYHSEKQKETIGYQDDDIIHTIETLYKDKTKIIYAEDWKSIPKTYYVKYETLKLDILLRIKQLLERGIKYMIIDE